VEGPAVRGLNKEVLFNEWPEDKLSLLAELLMSRSITPAVLVVFGLLSLFSSAQTKQVADKIPIYDNDQAYRVYDALFRYMGDNQHLHGDELAISTTTIVENPLLTQCLSDKANALPADAVADFKAQNAHFWTLLPRIPVGRNYELVSPADPRIEIEGLASNGAPGAQVHFPKPTFPGLWELSAVGFNQTQDRAIVDTFYTCGITCGFGGPFLMSKHGEGWQVDSWLCHIVS
jgi:hypothetical protein